MLGAPCPLTLQRMGLSLVCCSLEWSLSLEFQPFHSIPSAGLSSWASCTQTHCCSHPSSPQHSGLIHVLSWLELQWPSLWILAGSALHLRGFGIPWGAGNGLGALPKGPVSPLVSEELGLCLSMRAMERWSKNE